MDWLEGWVAEIKFNTLTAGPHPSNVKSMSLSRTGAEQAANLLKKNVNCNDMYYFCICRLKML